MLDPERRELRRADALVAVEPQVFDLIDFLVRNRERVVTRDDLLDAVWNGRVVSESTLASRINAARRALNDTGEEQRLIRTVARKGVRFVGAVEEAERKDASPAPDASGAAPSVLPLPDRPAIAVLPFTNLSGEPEQEYFSDGISEDIITALSKLRWFFVIARNSSFIYKGKAVHMNQVAEELGVRYVVEGSVRKEGGRVRITAQLNDVATGAHYWQSATIARSPTCSPCRTRSPRTSCGDRAEALRGGKLPRARKPLHVGSLFFRELIGKRGQGACVPRESCG